MPFDDQPYFRYETLNAFNESFRLCRLLPGSGDSLVLCELINEIISTQSGHYEALSYTWGTDRQHRWIKLNGKSYYVQPNLLLALRAIRKHDESFLVWIDAICINQSDAAERVHQVSLMRDIYQNARKVLAWIGPAADDSDTFFDYLENLSKKDDLQTGRRAAAKSALRHLNKRLYWRRAWIKQELILSRDITVYCGSRKSHNMESFFWCGSLDSIDEVEGYEDYILKLYMHRIARDEGKSETLMELMERYSSTGCLHIRDRVFALYSMAADCQDPGSMIIDYEISIPVLFFTLLAHLKPSDVLRFAAILQDVLNVRSIQLQEYWDSVSTEPKGPIFSGVETLAVSYIRQMKTYGKSLSSTDCIPTTPDFFVRSCVAKFAPEGLGKSDKYIRIHNTKFYLQMMQTLLGLRLRRICERKTESEGSEEGGIVLHRPSFTMSDVWKYMVIPSLLLKEAGGHFYKAETLDSVESAVITVDGTDVANPSIDIVCYILAELSVHEPKYMMCLVDCRYTVCTLYGYTLLRPIESKKE